MVDMCRVKKTVWRNSAVEETESERCELVLNVVFYWKPVEFFQKRFDMITLRLFENEPCGVVLNLLYARDLFIGYTCKSSMIMDATSFSVELLDRNRRIDAILLSARNVVRQRQLMCCFIDSVWSRYTPRYVTVV